MNRITLALVFAVVLALVFAFAFVFVSVSAFVFAMVIHNPIWPGPGESARGP